MSSLDRETLVFGMMLPALIVGAILFFASQVRQLRDHSGGLIGALALLVGIYSGYIALQLGPLRPLHPGSVWLVHIPLLALPAGWLLGSLRPWWFTVTALGLTGFVAVVPTIPDWWGMVIMWGTALGYATLFGGTALLSESLSSVRISLALSLTAGTALLMLMQAEIDRPAKVAAMVLAIAVVTVLVSLMAGRDVLLGSIRGMVPGTIALIAALMFAGYLSSRGAIPPPCFAAVTLAPIGVAVRDLPAINRLPMPARDALSLVGLGMPLTYAIINAMTKAV